MVEQILGLPEETKTLLLAPVVENRKGEHRDLLLELREQGYTQLRIDGVVRELVDMQTLAKNKKHNIEVVVDRLVIERSQEFKKRLTEAALKKGRNQIIVHVQDREDLPMSEVRSSPCVVYRG